GRMMPTCERDWPIGPIMLKLGHYAGCDIRSLSDEIETTARSEAGSAQSSFIAVLSAPGLIPPLEDASEIKPKLWIVSRSYDLDRQNGSSAFSPEQRVDCFQDNRFPSACGLRQLGLESHCS